MAYAPNPTNARERAQANANLTGEDFCHWIDVSGNHQVTRLSACPPRLRELATVFRPKSD